MYIAMLSFHLGSGNQLRTLHLCRKHFIHLFISMAFKVMIFSESHNPSIQQMFYKYLLMDG